MRMHVACDYHSDQILKGIIQTFFHMHLLYSQRYTGNHNAINIVKTAPISPLFNCTHMPQGIAINHLNTPRSIPQASLRKWQLPGQID